MSAEFLTGAMRDKPAWHNLGLVKEGGWDNATAAFTDGGLMYRYNTIPLFVPVTKADGETIELGTGKFALVREPVPTVADSGYEVIDVVSDQYEIVQNETLAEILNPLSEQWKIDTVGALGNGDRVFATMDMGNRAVDGLGANGKYSEDYKHFVFVSNNHKKEGSIQWVYTNIRVVCNNTWVAALAEGIVSASIGHRGDPELKLRFQAELQQAVIQSEAQAVALFQKASQMKVDNAITNEFLEKVFFTPSRPNLLEKIDLARASGMTGDTMEKMVERAKNVQLQHDANVERAIEKRVNSVILLEKFNDEFPKVANTLYAVGQAANELVNHGSGRNDDNTAARSMDILFGSRNTELLRINTVMGEYVK